MFGFIVLTNKGKFVIGFPVQGGVLLNFVLELIKERPRHLGNFRIVDLVVGCLYMTLGMYVKI